MRYLVRTLLLAVAVLAAAVAAPSPAQGQGLPTCPVMTDSIVRLYQAYFQRDPDPSGFRHWVGLWSSGQASLAQISNEMAWSDELGDIRNLSNSQFVDWIYTNVVPEVDDRHRQFWIDTLNDGYPRGSAMLAFTESREYVAQTSTTIPLAGFLRWYPEGTHWHCGVGSAGRSVRPLVGDVWADYFFRNRSGSPDPIQLWTVEGSGLHAVNMVNTVIQPGFTDYNWDGSFSGDGDYGHSIDVVAGPTTDWIVVFYPRSIGADRLGWQIS